MRRTNIDSSAAKAVMSEGASCAAQQTEGQDLRMHHGFPNLVSPSSVMKENEKAAYSGSAGVASALPDSCTVVSRAGCTSCETWYYQLGWLKLKTIQLE